LWMMKATKSLVPKGTAVATSSIDEFARPSGGGMRM
jgi:hypothetical protein